MIRNSTKSIKLNSIVASRTTTTTTRLVHSSSRILAKGDSSTIDSYRLPSQTSINEWEFKYDFIPKTSEPKVPPLTKEAVKQDIAHEKAKSVERELFAKESNSSIKVEANDAKVVHGGESVAAEPVLKEDTGSAPIDVSTPKSNINVSSSTTSTKPKKSANHDKYVQSSINPNINSGNVVNLSEGEVDHKTESVDKQSPVVEDIEHDNLTHQGETKKESNDAGLGIFALLGLGGAGYYYYSSTSKK